MLIVLVLWSLAIYPVACSTPQPSEQPTESRAEPRAQERPTQEKAQDAGPDLQVEAFKEPTREAVPESKVEPEPEPIVEVEPTAPEQTLDESSTVDSLLQEIIPESMFPKPGFGSLTGQCNILDEKEWKTNQSYLFRNTLDLGTMKFDESKLTQGGRKIWKDGNLGGSSVHSEVFAYEVLHRCESASLLKSEGEILYRDKSGKKTDLLVTIDARKVGVSVTRAFHFPPTKPYTEKEATTLLTKKLKDVPLSASNADVKDAWVRSVLHILAYNKQYADTVEVAYKKLDSSLKSSTILIVTVTDGNDDYIY